MSRRRRSKLNALLIFLLTLLVLVAIMLAVHVIHKTGDYLDEMRYFPKDKDDPEQLVYEDYVRAASEEFSVDMAIIYAVIYCESDFDPKATSSVGAMGLMQMMPATFEEMQDYLKETYDTEALYDPEVSIRYGTYYLSRLYRSFGDWEIVFAAYNAGPTCVREWLGDENYAEDGKLVDIPYPETARYVEKVKGMVEKYKELYQTEVQNDT